MLLRFRGKFLGFCDINVGDLLACIMEDAGSFRSGPGEVQNVASGCEIERDRLARVEGIGIITPFGDQ